MLYGNLHYIPQGILQSMPLQYGYPACVHHQPGGEFYQQFKSFYSDYRNQCMRQYPVFSLVPVDEKTRALYLKKKKKNSACNSDTFPNQELPPPSLASL